MPTRAAGAAYPSCRESPLPGTEAILWLRFGVPLLAGVIAYGVAPDPVAVESCRLGKLAGVAQVATLCVALAGLGQPPAVSP